MVFGVPRVCLLCAVSVGAAVRLALCRNASWITGGLPDGFALEGTGGGHPGTWLAPFVPSCDWLLRQMPSLGDPPVHRKPTMTEGNTP